jgi:hypothetical protein
MMREQNGNNKLQTPPKTVLHDIGKGYKNQPHNVSWFTLQAGGHRFDPGHVHHISLLSLLS